MRKTTRLGRTSEARVRMALNFLTEKGYIRGSRQTKRFSEEDKQGIDFWIFTNDFGRIPLQVKSSPIGKIIYDKNNSAHPCIVGTWSFEKLTMELISILEGVGHGRANG